MWSVMRLCASPMELNIEYRARSDECRGAKRGVETGQSARNRNDGHTDSAFAFLHHSSLLARYSIFSCCATEATAMTSRNLPAQATGGVLQIWHRQPRQTTSLSASACRARMDNRWIGRLRQRAANCALVLISAPLRQAPVVASPCNKQIQKPGWTATLCVTELVYDLMSFVQLSS